MPLRFTQRPVARFHFLHVSGGLLGYSRRKRKPEFKERRCAPLGLVSSLMACFQVRRLPSRLRIERMRQSSAMREGRLLSGAVRAYSLPEALSVTVKGACKGGGRTAPKEVEVRPKIANTLIQGISVGHPEWDKSRPETQKWSDSQSLGAHDGTG